MWLAYVMCAIAGVLLALQPPSTAALGQYAGAPSFSSLISFLVGLAAIIVYFLIDSDLGNKIDPKGLSNAPWWAWIGGLFGAFYIIVITVFTQQLGAAVLVGIIVAIQILASGILDHFGWLNLPVRPMDWSRGLGIALIILGVIIMNKKTLMG